jgi:DNA-binding transcriptional LysR family regulator
MDLSRLRALRELSTRGTMAAVAQALHLTPSAVSQQIALLEDDAGMPLTERRGRGVRLTHAGQVLAQHADG